MCLTTSRSGEFEIKKTYALAEMDPLEDFRYLGTYLYLCIPLATVLQYIHSNLDNKNTLKLSLY